jgi:hypothetical protein
MPDTTSQNPSLPLIFQEVKDVLRAQLDQVDKLDTKVGLLLGTAGVALAVVFSHGFLPAEGKRLTSIFLVLGLASIAGSMVFALVALWIRDFNLPPHPRALREYYLSEQEDETRLKLVDTWVFFHKYNEAIISRKVLWARFSAVLLAGGLALLVLTFVYNSVGGLP